MFLGKFMSKNHNIVSKTVYFSLLVQIITTLISIDGITYKLKPKDNVLTDILILETVVQIVEAVFYVWVIFALSNLSVMSSRRYYDWFITTPIMLFTTIIFMEYKKHPERIITFKKFISENTKEVVLLFFTNFFMLVFGLLNETKILSKIIAIPIGTLFFLYGFYIIYEKYAKYTELGRNLFLFLFIVWGLYGVAACLNDTYKNTMYNCLDIVSKNFYGLYIYYYIRSL